MIVPKTSELARVRRWITAEIGELLSADRLQLLLVAVSEAVTNAIEGHHRASSTEPVIVAIDRDGGQVSVEDHAGGFDTDPDDLEAAVPQQLRGRGLMLMKSICPDLSIRPTKHGTLIVLPFPPA